MSKLERKDLEESYFELAQQLEEKYPNKSFRNHCYWRIALDQVADTKWSNKFGKPAYKKIKTEELKEVISLLKKYLINEALLAEHNKLSLDLRRN